MKFITSHIMPGVPHKSQPVVRILLESATNDIHRYTGSLGNLLPVNTVSAQRACVAVQIGWRTTNQESENSPDNESDFT